MTPAKDPVTQWTDAVLAAEVSALRMLKAEMEGLNQIFGGEGWVPSGEEGKAAEAETEDSFDNMPV